MHVYQYMYQSEHIVIMLFVAGLTLHVGMDAKLWKTRHGYLVDCSHIQ